MAKLGSLFGKLFGTGTGRLELPLRAYGKLPLYAEYRRLEVAPGAPTSFSRWLDEGRLAWVRSAASSPAGVMRPSRMMILPPDQRDFVLASIWDSRDSLGRPFPFCFFVVCPPASLGQNPHQQWAAADVIFSQFDALHAELHRLGRGGDFYKVYGKRTLIAAPEDVERRAAELWEKAGAIPADGWFARSHISSADNPGDWYGSLLRRANRWRANPAGLADLAVACPVADGFAPSAQAVMWLQWLSGVVRRAGRPVQMIVPAPGAAGPALLHVLLRPLLPDDFQLLTTGDGRYGYVEQLAQVPPVSTDSGVLARVAAPTGPLLNWLAENAPLNESGA